MTSSGEGIGSCRQIQERQKDEQPTVRNGFHLDLRKKLSGTALNRLSLLCCGQVHFHIPRRAPSDSSERLRTVTVSDSTIQRVVELSALRMWRRGR